PRKIGPEAPSGNFQGLLIDLSCPYFNGEHGLQLHNRKVRDHGSRTRLLKDAVHVNGSVFLVVALGERAGVEKIAWQNQRSCRRAITASEREPEIVESARLTSSKL